MKRRNSVINICVSSKITLVRLGLVPLLVLLVDHGLVFSGVVLFLFLILTDFLDGHLARKHRVYSKVGAYFDAITDFILIFSLFLVFGPEGFYSEWVLIVVVAVFAWFILTGISFDRIYDPVGKYYGSLLYGVIGLRFVFSGSLFCNLVTGGIVVFSVASILSRVIFLLKKQPSH